MNYDKKNTDVRYLQWNAALNALIGASNFNGTEFLDFNADNLDDLLAAREKFEKEIDSQIHAYGKEETLKVVTFLKDTIYNDAPEIPSGINFTEEQKTFLSKVKEEDKKQSLKTIPVREYLINAYCKCDWGCI